MNFSANNNLTRALGIESHVDGKTAFVRFLLQV